MLLFYSALVRHICSAQTSAGLPGQYRRGMDIVETVQQWGWTSEYDWEVCHFRKGWESWNCLTWRSHMGYLTNVCKYLMWELNISLRLFSVGDQEKNKGWWMLPEIQEIHSNKQKIFFTMRVVITQKQIAHIGGVSILGDIQMDTVLSSLP